MPLPTDPKDILLRYFDVAHDAFLWKLEGLSDYDVRRPLTPTGTNLLGLAKHVAWVELGYFGEVFDRPHGVTLPDRSDDDPHADMYAAADESRDDIVTLFKQAQGHAHATIEALDLDALGTVPWWGDNNPVTLQLIIVHMTTEIYRHLGHVDILRESIDGAVGMREAATNMPPGDANDWRTLVDKLEQIAVSQND